MYTIQLKADKPTNIKDTPPPFPMASKSKIFSLLLVLLLSFSHHCLAHHCTCQCDMTSRKNSSGSGSSNTGSTLGSANSGSSNTGSSSGSSNFSIPGNFGSVSTDSGGSSNSPPSNTGSSTAGSWNSDSSTSGNSSSGSPTQQSGQDIPSNSGYQQSISGNKPLDFGFKPCFKSIIAFGDSFTDTGNAPLMGGLKAFANAFKPGSPYGSSFSDHSTPRFCDGRILVDFLCEVLHLPHLAPFQNKSADFSKGVNFAVGGSSAFNKDFFQSNDVGRILMWKAVPDCLNKQQDWFQEFLNNRCCDGLNTLQCKTKLASSLFWVGEMGYNDYARNFGSFMSTQSIMQKLIDFKVNLAKALLDKGAKYMIVQGIPPLGCFPLHMSTASSGDKDDNGCSSGFNSITKTHNDLLVKKLDGLRKQFPDCFISYADFWNAYLTILKNPSQHGFSETFKVCCGSGAGPFNFDSKCLCGSPKSSKCGNPAQFMSWDGLHPTEAMYGKLADLFFNKDFCNPPFKQLLNAVGPQ